jgi:23S rRNA (cytidine1920-2'-O)/16S rRNA (cytidine1409-2'-O)-methyltransferase
MKERLDVRLVQLGYFDSREKAKAAIMAGIVFCGSERLEKPGLKVDISLDLIVKGALHPYVSRGGLKLKKARREFSIDPTGRVLLDIGASTGGFTDCALQNGAKYVYAIDVGYNQLDWSLRNDPRVHVMERTNFRYLTRDQLTQAQPDMAVIDVSFISLRLILPVVKSLLDDEAVVVALIKPQFEAGREQVGKSGVVRDSNVHEQVLREVLSFATSIGFYLKGLTFSPITGGEGNIEFLASWTIQTSGSLEQTLPDLREVIDQAKQSFS